MNFLAIFLIFLTGLFDHLVINITAEAFEEANYTCGLLHFEPNTPATPYIVSPAPDNITSGERIWETPMFGSVTGTSYYQHPHGAYLVGGFGSGTYHFTANSKTKDFVNEQGTRNMIRRILIKCQDGNNPEYSFIIPILNMHQKQIEFEKKEYIFNIPRSWDITHPISSEHFVIVRDKNGQESLSDDKNLTYVSAPPLLKITAYPFWVFPDEPLFYRLDIFLNSIDSLKIGQTNYSLSAMNDNYAGKANIVVIVF